jgi:hypothetical protein
VGRVAHCPWQPEDSDLQLYGPTSVFQFAPKVSEEAPEVSPDLQGTYILLVEGVHEICYDPSFDWSRHLPQEVPLDRREHDK